MLILLLACNSTPCEVDLDGDGYPSAASCRSGTDCDDLDPAVHPGAEELCNGLDDDCDGYTDDRVVDYDGDGFYALGCPGGNDCDDLDPTVHPGAEEICDGRDNDCDQRTDDVDLDGDGFSPLECGGLDCDDGNIRINPDSPEDCDDGIDNDCDGRVDVRDTDGDGDTHEDCGGVDCDDLDPTVSGTLDEYCGDGKDNDCNGTADDADLDKDGVTDEACGGGDCDDGDEQVHDGLRDYCDGVDRSCDGDDSDDRDDDGRSCSSDCNDGLPNVYSGRSESCDGLDNDCDGDIDETSSSACTPRLPGGMDFAISANGWDLDGSTFLWADEAVVAVGGSTGNWQVAAYDSYKLEPPFVFEADITRRGGTGDSNIGIYLSRNGGNADGYYLVLNHAGTKISYDIGRLVNGNALSETGDIHTPVIMPGEGLPNRLRIEHDGWELKFYINEQKVRGYSVSGDLSQGYPAFVVEDRSDDAVDAAMDNVWVEQD